MKFRKKPVVIEAVQFNGHNAEFIRAWMGAPERDGTFRNNELEIKTLEGTMKASPGDWVIRGVKGEFYPCKPDIFAETYEAVEP